jgi:hypothetical protein
MHSDFEAPGLILVGNAEDVVFGSGLSGGDLLMFASEDFAFELDS